MPASPHCRARLQLKQCQPRPPPISPHTQACRSRGRLYLGGAFNLVGDAVAFNFGYFEGGNWTSPPVTIGPDPMTLLYHDEGLRSPDSQGKGGPGG